jgi:hypothetical protein
VVLKDRGFTFVRDDCPSDIKLKVGDRFHGVAKHIGHDQQVLTTATSNDQGQITLVHPVGRSRTPVERPVGLVRHHLRGQAAKADSTPQIWRVSSIKRAAYRRLRAQRQSEDMRASIHGLRLGSTTRPGGRWPTTRGCAAAMVTGVAQGRRARSQAPCETEADEPRPSTG